MIVYDKNLSDLEHQDALAKRLYDHMMAHPKREYKFYDLSEFLGADTTRTLAAIKVLKRNRLVKQVAYDNKDGGTFRVIPFVSVVDKVVQQLEEERVITDMVLVMEGHEPWCMLGNDRNPRCTCKPKELPKQKELPETVPAQPEKQPDMPTPPPTPPATVTSIDRPKFTRDDALEALAILGEANSSQVADLLALGDGGINRVSAVLSLLYNEGRVERTPQRVEGSYKYKLRTSHLITQRSNTYTNTGEVDPYRALFMQSLYDKIRRAAKLNEHEEAALKLALGLRDAPTDGE